jgi:hypothetical protein
MDDTKTRGGKKPTEFRQIIRALPMDFGRSVGKPEGYCRRRPGRIVTPALDE